MCKERKKRTNERRKDRTRKLQSTVTVSKKVTILIIVLVEHDISHNASFDNDSCRLRKVTRSISGRKEKERSSCQG